MNDVVKDLLFTIRQHPGFRDFLKEVEKPKLPRYRKSESLSLEEFGARSLFESGRLSQDENWRNFLIGTPPQADE